MRALLEELIQERRLRLDTKSVESLRKEFLTLMKNIPRLRNYRDGDKVRQATIRFRDRLEAYGNQVRSDLKDRKSRDPHSHSGWASEHLRTMKSFWDFTFEVGHMPLSSWGYIQKYHKGYASPDDYFRSVKKDIDKWWKRVKRKASPAWKWMKEVGEWAERKDPQGGGGRPVTFNTMEKEKAKIEGFQFSIVGFDEHDDFHNKGLGGLRAALRIYKQRAKRVFPWLLKYQLPMVAYFTDSGKSGRAAATYEKDHIAIYTWGIHAGSPQEGAHILAHEMGHHLFQSVLSGKAQKTWYDFIKGNYTTIDLRTVLSRLKPGETLLDLEKRIEKTDPILHLQLDTLTQTHEGLRLYGLTSIKDYLDGGGNPVFNVPKLPITGYAAKNPEEAFCEALGRLVGYGPRAVLPEVSNMLRSLVGLKVESRPWRRSFLDS